jgi:hypothetical protein
VPLQKILFKPGVNRENTRYTNEGGWYESDKVRFRQGTPEKIGGWTRFATATFLGVCRSLWNWITLAGFSLIGVGTNLKFYINKGGAYFDITPLRASSTINNNPFAATLGSATITVTDTAHGGITGDFVTFSGAVGLGGNITATVLNAEYQITVLTANTYTFTATATAIAADVSGSPGGGAAVVAAYQLNIGPETQQALVGWGAGTWGSGTWGYGTASTNILSPLRSWNQDNFGQDLIYGPRGGGVYYWNATTGVDVRGVNLTTLGDANTPLYQNFLIISDASRFVIIFGTNDPYATNPTELDPMLIRWSDQENPFVWIPAATNQAGSIRLSHGSQIVTAIQTRQEIVTFTDASVYSLQYLGPPYVWGTQLLGDNISIISSSSVALASGIVYWMGVDKFYVYDGRVQTLNCDLRRYVFSDINQDQSEQVFAGTNEGFNEVWWFYCSADSNTVDKYVVFNYLEKVWYYGTMARTAWLDSGVLDFPIAATYVNNIVNHEVGTDDNMTSVTAAIDAYISSSEFDIGDGHNFGYVWRVLPDLTFADSTTDPSGAQPKVTLTLYPMLNSGSGAGTPGVMTINKIAEYNITEEFTGIVYTRVRGRQMIFKLGSNQIGTNWQLGAPRIDVRPDGRR